LESFVGGEHQDKLAGLTLARQTTNLYMIIGYTKLVSVDRYHDFSPIETFRSGELCPLICSFEVYSGKSNDQLFLAPTSKPNGCAITINGAQISVPLSKIKSLSSNPDSGQISLELLDGTIGKVGYAKCPSEGWEYRRYFQSAFGEGDILLNQVRGIKRCESTETTPSPQQTKRLNPNV
jgi:hypothetical protein